MALLYVRTLSRHLCFSSSRTTTSLRRLASSSNSQDGDNDKPVKTSLTTIKDDKKEVILPAATKAHLSKYKTKEEIAKVPITAKLSAHYKNPQNLVKIPYCKPFESTYICNRPLEDPIDRSADHFRTKKNVKGNFTKEGYLAYYDIIIMGGGVMGCSVAFWLAQRVKEGFNILVIERDPQVHLSNCYND
jgi:hypothetical protein